MALTDIPTSYGTARVRAILPKARIGYFGDSWMVHTNGARLSRGLLVGWPRRAGEITAFASPVETAAGLTTPTLLATGQTSVDAGNDFVAWDTIRNALAQSKMLYWPAGSTIGASNNIMRITLNNSNPAGTTANVASVAGNVTRAATDGLGVRVIYLAPPTIADQCEGDWRDSDQVVRGTLPMRTAVRPRLASGANPFAGAAAVAPTAGRLNASPYSSADTARTTLQGDAMLLSGVNAGAPSIRIATSEIATKGICVHSMVMYRCGTTSRLPIEGAYIQGIVSGESWGYDSLVTDAVSTALAPKQYSDQQLEDLVDLTTINRDQDNVLVAYYATENKTAAQMQAIYAGWMARNDRIWTGLGLRAPHYIIIGNPLHKISSDATPEDSRDSVEAQNRGAYEAARAHPRACFVSLAKLTGEYFAIPNADYGGTTNAAEWDAWYTDRGYDRVLIDNVAPQDMTAVTDHWDEFILHPSAASVANFHAWLLREEIDSPGDDAEAATVETITRRARGRA